MSREASEYVSYEELAANTEKVAKKYKFPLESNLFETIANRSGVWADSVAMKKAIAKNANDTRPIVHVDCIKLMEDFLKHKRENGTPQEKAVYAEIRSVEAFVDRLLKKRPLAFWKIEDQALLRDGKTHVFEKTQTIGTNQEEPEQRGKECYNIKNYLSYEEMEISAFLGISGPTHFINKGDRDNKGKPSQEDNYQKEGICICQVGPRLEKPGVMEWKHLLITPTQNTPENGYGQKAEAGNPKTKALEHFARFYNQGDADHPRFPSYEEAANDTSGKYMQVTALNGDTLYLNVAAFKKRLRAVIEPYLIDANERAKATGVPAYLRPVGLGLGVWKMQTQNALEIETKLLLEVYADILSERQFESIADIDFMWIDQYELKGATNFKKGRENRPGEQIGILANDKNNITIHFSKNNPADKEDGKQVTPQSAWDSGSYMGNEYWEGTRYLNASGDPAAAASSYIGQSQNPDINPKVSGANLYVYSLEMGMKKHSEWVAENQTQSASTSSQPTISSSASDSKEMRLRNVITEVLKAMKHPEAKKNKITALSNLRAHIRDNYSNKGISMNQAQFDAVFSLAKQICSTRVVGFFESKDLAHFNQQAKGLQPNKPYTFPAEDMKKITDDRKNIATVVANAIEARPSPTREASSGPPGAGNTKRS